MNQHSESALFDTHECTTKRNWVIDHDSRLSGPACRPSASRTTTKEGDVSDIVNYCHCRIDTPLVNDYYARRDY